jgi:hypothetical protein
VSRYKKAPRIQLLVLTAFFLAGWAAAALWVVTAHKSRPGVMLERRVTLGEPVPDSLLIRRWNQVEGLERTILPGRHVHFPGLVSQLVIMNPRLSFDLQAAALARGEASTLNALAREPADAHAWARLAMFRHLKGGPSREVVSALRVSIYAAPAMKSLVFWRIRMAGLCRAHWDPEFENLVKRQIVLAQRISPRRLAATLAGLNIAWPE